MAAHPPLSWPHFAFHPPPSPDTNIGRVTGGSYFDQSNAYDLNSKIMLTAIISLSFVVLLVVSLHIYARCVLRRQARDMSIIRRLGLPATIHSYEPRATGLDPAVIDSLPKFVYGSQTTGDDQEMECAVCLSILEDQEMARLLPNCKHTFHAECIDKWLSSHSTCPICRTEAEPRVQPMPREGPAGGIFSIAPPLGWCSDGGNQCSGHKASSSISRLSSFRIILSRERSSRRIQDEVQEPLEDLERQ